MDGIASRRRLKPPVRRWVATILLAMGFFLPSSSTAFEALDGRLEVHGYFEMQVRTISQNFSDQWDLTQWYNIFNAELELEIIQETHGPLDLMSAFIRVEARFDCVYSRGCGMIRSADIYGNRARGMPRRLNSGDEYDTAGSIQLGNEGPWTDPSRNPYEIQQVPGFRGIYESTPEGLGPINRRVALRCSSPDGLGADAYCDENQSAYQGGRLPARFWNANRNLRVQGKGVLPADDGTEGAPYLIAMDNFKDFKFVAIPGPPGGAGNGHPLMLMGPWLPENFVEPIGSLSNLPNPLDSSRVSPQSLANGFGAKPMNPIPIYRENDPNKYQIYIYQETNPDDLGAAFPAAGRWQPINQQTGLFSDTRAWGDREGRGNEARGIFMPTLALREGMQERKFDSYPFNFTQLERAFNRGASQQDEGELKEAYLDIEMFDYRLWLRLGKQFIVWGKTELFRTTDQINPQDYAMSTLPSLEESRIGLWSARGVYSFYDVGPFQDVRLEVALNFDEYESADLGTCGEPYAVNLICQLTFGAMAHGALGVGVAGVEQPPDPWSDASGLEYGARLEWRWDRFSFALMDFYGYDDFPHIVRLSSYGRNVDWRSGRPRYLMPDVQYMAEDIHGCATPGYMDEQLGEITQGVVQSGVPESEYDFNAAPNAVGASLNYQSTDGYQREGCLTPGATNREFRVLAELGIDGETEYHGVPYRVPWMPVNSGGYGTTNSLYTVTGRFMNDTAYSDPNDPRRDYSIATTEPGVTPELDDWRAGPQAHLCASESNPAGLPTSYPGCGDYERGRRVFNPVKNFQDSEGPCQGVAVGQCEYAGAPNPAYNPFYDPRFDRYFKASQLWDGRGDQTGKGDWYSGFTPLDEESVAFNPGVNQVTGELVVTEYDNPETFDAFQISRNTRDWRALGIWQNAYDPNLETYDPRNALYQSPVNASVYNWVCSVTTGFADIDPSACALTVFSSSKQPAGSDQNDPAPRISTLINAFVMGSIGFNSFLGRFPSDELLSKGPALPDSMGMPTIHLHEDVGPGEANVPGRGFLGRGLNAFRTWDYRRQWADLAAGVDSPYIYSREQESYNCLGPSPIVNAEGGVELCGGLQIQKFGPSVSAKFRSAGFLGRVLTPEQEALLGCGPFFGTSCDANGADLLWGEASTMTQAFVGSDSIGISFEQLGIAHLVPASYGTHLMDNGSDPFEYRIDGRVRDKDGYLIRICKPDPSDPSTWVPCEGSGGFVANGGPGNNSSLYLPPDAREFFDTLPCDINTDSLFTPGSTSGTLNPFRDRASSRCWDLRDYYRVYGIQPGTAAFSIMELGGPVATTADYGGPLDPAAGVLPGTRDKWSSLLYRPLPSWDGTEDCHPNNPDCGYVGNHWYGQILSYRNTELNSATGLPEHKGLDTWAAPDPRRDYRQWSKAGGDFTEADSLAYEVPCTYTGTAVDPGPNTVPENYDCYINNPSSGTWTEDGKATVALPNDWTEATPGWGPGTARYQAAAASKSSGLNWGVFSSEISGCNPNGQYTQDQMLNNPDCYLGGWSQTVDGDPDRLGLPATALNFGVPVYAVRYPRPVAAVGLGSYPASYGGFLFVGDEEVGWVDGQTYDVQWGMRQEGGCTSGVHWPFIQKTFDGQGGYTLLPPADCAEVFRGNPYASMDDRGGSGHVFTGESFANEMAGASANLQYFLVAFSEEFLDGLASVRGYVNPERYETRYIYDEDWMWDFTCDGITKTADECGGRLFEGMAAPFRGQPLNDVLWQPGNVPGGTPDPSEPGRFAYSAYGDTNRNPATLELPTLENGGRYRQVAGLEIAGLNNIAGPAGGANATAEQWERYRLARSEHVPNPLANQAPDTENKLQRDPSLRNILTDFPDLLQNECISARRDFNESMGPEEVRNLYEQCGKVSNGGRADWDAAAQAIRLGDVNGEGGLLESMMWDYAFTGSENDLMAMIPYCENVAYSQRDVSDMQFENNVPEPFIWGGNRIDCTRGEEGEVLGRERCNFVTPQFCGLVQALSGIAGQKRNVLRAGGNSRFGRKTAQWQSGSQVYLSYEKRNVLGFSMDFGEDLTKTSWNVEFTWIEGVPKSNADSYNLTTDTDDFNLTISVDRPTFINFLNANRTIFFNSQWFIGYRKGWEDSFSSIGPWNVLATFAMFTGYFQDRLNPQLVFVYDFRSRSGGALPSVNYRFSDTFSITVGAALFSGSTRYIDMPVNGIGPAGLRGGSQPYMDGDLPGLSIVRDRDEVYMILRYTF